VKISDLTIKLTGPAHNADITVKQIFTTCRKREEDTADSMVGKGKGGIRNVRSEKYEREKEALKMIFKVGIEKKLPSTHTENVKGVFNEHTSPEFHNIWPSLSAY
jgi:hypothetical protein